LRNDKKAKKAIVDLLLASKTENRTKGEKQMHAPLTSPPTSDLTEVQDLLLRGERESAVSEALTQKNYALALLIASMCDRTTYRITARRFADEALAVGSPLHTATLLFSDNLEIPDDEELLDPYGKRARRKSFWYDDEIYGTLVETWREQLASIMCNQTAGWERFVVSLGDRLLQLGQCHAAHVCYLVSFSSFGPPSKNTTRLALLGCDHRNPMNQMLMTPQSIQSFQRTEAFEWARRRGNRKTHIPSLQPFKFRYAELLADFGYEELAREYLLSVHSCIGLGSDKTSNIPSAATQDLNFIESLKLLDDRICGSSGAKQSSWESEDKSKGGVASSALGSIMKSVLGKKPKAAVLPPEQKQENQDTIFSHQDDYQIEESSPHKPELNLSPQRVELHKKPQVTGGNAVASTTLARDEGYIATKPTFKQGATVVDTPKSFGFSSNPFSHNTPASVRGTVASISLARDASPAKPSFKPAPAAIDTPKPSGFLSDPFSRNTPANVRGPVVGEGNGPSMNDQQGPPSSAPPMFWGDNVKNDGEEEPTYRKEEEKKEMILSTPSQATKKDETKKAPVSEPPSE
jgi:hypothetical protein